jgi:polysaccharide transporter, PST family
MLPGSLWNRLRNNTLVRNVVSLFGIQFAGYAAPLITVPYLARVLGLRHWGLVAFAQSFGMYTMLIVDFGFSLSATREVAKHRHDREKLSEIFAGVIAAKAILSLVCLLVATAVVLWVPQFRDKRLLMYAATACGIAQAYSVAWLYQGLERMGISSIIDILSKVLFSISVFTLVHSPGDDWLVLVIQCFWSVAATLVLTVRAYRECSFCWPTVANTIQALKSSASMFFYRSAVTVYTTANTLLLGFVAGPVSVGCYAAADKITRVMFGLTMPISQAVFPRMNYLVKHDMRSAARLAKKSLLLNVSLGWLLFAVTFVSAPLAVRVGFGPGYEAVVPLVRIMAVLIPTLACSFVLGCQYMLPLEMDRQFIAITICTGAFNIIADLVLVHRYSHFGIAWAVVMTEIIVTVSQFVVLARRAPDFLFNTESTVLAAAKQQI